MQAIIMHTPVEFEMFNALRAVMQIGSLPA